MRDYLARLDVPCANMFYKPRKMTLYTCLVHAKSQALIERVAYRHGVECWPVNADDRHGAALANRVDRPMQCRGGSRLHLHVAARECLHGVSSGFAPYRIDADVGAEPVGGLLDVHR